MKRPLSFLKASTKLMCLHALLLLLKSNFAYADAWKAYVTQEQIRPGYQKYTFRIVDWDFSSTVPNPLYGCDITVMHCSVAIATVQGQDYTQTRVDKSKAVVSAKTIGELGRVMQDTGRWFGKTHEMNLQSTRACSFPGYMRNGGTFSVLPGGKCTYGELPPATCKLDAPTLEIRHAEYEKNVNGSRASANINVTCTEPMKVSIRGQLSGVNSIILDSKTNFESVITLNEKPLSTGVEVSASSSPTAVTVTSTLKGTPPPGEYQGNTVIIVSLP
ncbi:MrpH family fimbial adhesin [Enterobacter cloacae]